MLARSNDVLIAVASSAWATTFVPPLPVVLLLLFWPPPMTSPRVGVLELAEGDTAETILAAAAPITPRRLKGIEVEKAIEKHRQRYIDTYIYER